MEKTIGSDYIRTTIYVNPDAIRELKLLILTEGKPGDSVSGVIRDLIETYINKKTKGGKKK